MSIRIDLCTFIPDSGGPVTPPSPTTLLLWTTTALVVEIPLHREAAPPIVGSVRIGRVMGRGRGVEKGRVEAGSRRRVERRADIVGWTVRAYGDCALIGCDAR